MWHTNFGGVISFDTRLSVTLLGVLCDSQKPTIAGPLSAKGFWMLDDANASRDAGYQDCGSIDGAGCCEAHPEWHFPMWACDMLPNRTVTSFEIAFSDKHLDGQKFWSTLAGHINHFGCVPRFTLAMLTM